MEISGVMLTVGLMVLVVLAQQCQTRSSGGSEKMCLYLGKQFRVGELVTGNVCDRCYCTQHGIMCEMVKCPTANCHDKVKGKCCYECPNGPNCLYESENSTSFPVLVPETGCIYSEGVVCHCSHDKKMADKEETECMPALPGDSSPPCTPHMP